MHAQQGGAEKYIENFYSENLKGRDCLVDMGIGRGIILKCILKKYIWRICTGFFEFRVETSGGLLLTRQ
jgi:hypothetical protein